MKATSADKDVLPAGTSFHREAFLARVNSDLDHVLDLVELFLEMCPESVRHIEAAVERQDAEAIRETAHRFKGSLQFIHAEPAIAATQRLEQIGRQHQTGEVAEAFDDLVRQVRRLSHDLRA